jgi:TRAP-type C4-dicarboxylate transport system permease small subunit
VDAFLAFSQRVKAVIDSVLGTIAAIMLLILTLFALLEIVRRYGFDLVYEWGNDAVVVGMIATISIYIAVTQVRRSHLVMNAILQLLNARGYYKTVGVLRIVVSAITVVFCSAIGVTGWATLTYAYERDLMTYSLLIPLWPFFLTLMIGFLLMAFVALLQFIEDIIAFVREEHLDGEFEVITDV